MRVVGRIALVLVLAIAQGAWAQIRLEGVDLSGGEDEAAQQKEEESAGSLGLDLREGPEVPDEVDVRMRAATRLFEERNYEAAALGFWEIIQDPKAASAHSRAEYMLGKSLYRLGMYHSALAIFKRILERGESDRFFATSLEWLFFIAHKTTNQTVVLDEIARFAGVAFPERYQDEYRYLLAKYNFVRGRALMDAHAVQGGTTTAYADAAQQSLEEARRLVAMIGPGSPFYPKAKYLEGLALYATGKPALAVESFKDVVRATNPRREDTIFDPKLRELAFMQLARIHYEHRQNRYANFYYSRIVRGSDQWLASLFESAWAYFRLGEDEKALGNLLTLRSPFFKDEYYPEAMLLEAVIYYENCRYPEARRAVESFLERYGPLHRALTKLLERELPSPQAYWDALAGLEEGEENELLARIVRMALSDQELRHLSDSIAELEAEVKSISQRREIFRFSGLARHLIAELEEQRRALAVKAGHHTKRKLEREARELGQLNYRALAIKAEISSREKEALQASLEKGESVTVVRPYRYSTAVDDEHVYWPYEGEFWRDELGSYEYTLTRGCKEK